MDLITLDAPIDSALLWALVCTACGLATTRCRPRRTSCTGRLRGPGSRPNLLLTDGAADWATTWTQALRCGRRRARSRSRLSRSDSSRGVDGGPDRHRWSPRGGAAPLCRCGPAATGSDHPSRIRSEESACDPQRPDRRLPHPGRRACRNAHGRAGGLTSRPKQLPPKYFYDARGSALFE